MGPHIAGDKIAAEHDEIWGLKSNLFAYESVSQANQPKRCVATAVCQASQRMPAASLLHSSEILAALSQRVRSTGDPKRIWSGMWGRQTVWITTLGA